MVSLFFGDKLHGLFILEGMVITSRSLGYNQHSGQDPFLTILRDHTLGDAQGTRRGVRD